MSADARSIAIHRFGYGEGGERVERFLALRDAIYAGDYYHRPEAEGERLLLDHYAGRPDYRFELLLAEAPGRGDVARVLVGRNRAYDFAFFGFFECANDLAVFRALMERACACARELGERELRGPIELNALHGWMFLDWSDSEARFVGDPYHRAHHPALFRAEGWEIGDRSVSGMVVPAAQRAILAERGRAEEAMTALGVKAYRLGEVPEETFWPDAWRVVREAFTPELHRYVPVELPVFRAQTAPVLARLRDPASLLLMYRGEECAGFCLSYANFIDEFCNPDGRKVPPGRGERPSPFSMKTFGVADRYRGRGVFKAMLALSAEHAETRYRHAVAWRRTNVQNPGTTRLRENARITDSYLTFRRAV